MTWGSHCIAEYLVHGTFRYALKASPWQKSLTWGLAHGQTLWLSLQTDPAVTVNNLAAQLPYTQLEKCGSSDAFSVSPFKHTSVLICAGFLISSWCTVVASLAAHCGWSCRHDRHSKGPFALCPVMKQITATWPCDPLDFPAYCSVGTTLDLHFLGPSWYLLTGCFAVETQKNKLSQTRRLFPFTLASHTA